MSSAWIVVLMTFSLGQIVNAGCSGICQLDLCLVMDKSGSISIFNKAKASMVNLMDQLDIGPAAIQVGLVDFEGNAHLIFDLDDYPDKNDVKNGINSVSPSNFATKLSTGINKARTECFGSANGDRDGVPNVILMVTDGKSTMGGDNFEAEANAARGEGIEIIVLGIKNPNVDAINKIAGGIQANIFDADDSSPPATYNFATIVPALKIRLLQLCIFCKVDVCFVLDESASVVVFNAVKQFVKDFIDVMNIGSTGTRVGLVTFYTSAYLKFDLDEHFTKSAIFDAIDIITAVAGSTKLSSGIEKARTDCFGSANGDRAGVQNVMYVMTDGKSTVPNDDVQGAADAARGDGIIVVGIGVARPNMAAMSVIAGGISDHTINADDYNSKDQFDPDYTPLEPVMEAHYLTNFCGIC